MYEQEPDAALVASLKLYMIYSSFKATNWDSPKNGENERYPD